MKKFFTFCAAMLVAFAVNAATININNSTADALRLALYYANDGDEIVMAGGVYEESNSDYIAFDKNITVRAAEGAVVTVKPHVSATISGGVKAEIIGLKWDASELTTLDDYEHLFRAEDATAGNRLVFKGCEFSGFDYNNSMIYCASDKKLDSLIIEGCYIHDGKKSVVFCQNTDMKGLHINNSTIYNISTDANSYWAGIIDPRTTAVELRVDHCTFVNCYGMNSDYGNIGYRSAALSNAVVNNCIFAWTASTDKRATYLAAGSSVSNCITYNTTKDGSTWGHHSGPTFTNCSLINPAFVDAANADFTLGATSPALGAGTDGSNLGDPFWWPREIYFYNALGWTAPHVNFYVGSYWDDAKGSGNYYTSPQVGKPNVAMTQVGTSNVWKANYSGLYNYVSFTSESQDNSGQGMGNFWNIAGASYRGDFDPESELNMFVPNTVSNGTYNGVNYYSNGLWAPYTITYADLNYKTLCLPVGGTLTGASAYEVTAVDDVNGVVTLSDATTTLTAGVAYVIKPTANTISIAYAGAPVFTGVMNYLRGNLEVPQGWQADASWQAYILINNEFCKIEGSATADIALYKAFLKVTNSSAPSVIRIVENATNINNIEAADEAVKFFQNGKLFIKKNGVVYDMMGAVVK